MNTKTIMHSSQIIRFIFASLFVFASGMVKAEQWYQVELVVFEHINAYSDEQWPITDIEIESLSPNSANRYIQPASPDKLANIAASLSRSANYRVHYYQSWQQSMLTKGRAKTLSIESDNEMVSGSIKLYKATYLHANLDLWLMENQAQTNSWSDSSPEGIDISAPRNPNLQEARRIRSKKVYHFDHPKFGALLELTPIKTPQAAMVDIEQLESYSLPSEAAPITTE